MFCISSAICLATIAVNTVIHVTTTTPGTVTVTATTFTIINKVFRVHTLKLHKSCQGSNKIIIALTFLGCWGLSTSMSPFSGTTLFMSRVTDTPPHQIGWYWMPILALPSTIIVAIFVIGLRNIIF